MQKLWEASDLIDEHIGDEPVTPLAPRIAVRAAEHDLPAGLVAALDGNLRASRAGDRLDEVLAEVVADPRRGRLAAARRADRPDPRLAGAAQRPLREPLLDRRRRDARAVRAALGHAARPDRRERSPRRRAHGRSRLDELHVPALDELRAQAEGLASSEEELLLLGLFGEEAERLLRAIRGRATGDENLETAFERARAERIREVVRIVQETGVGEVTIEEDGMRVSVADARAEPQPAAGRSSAVAVPPRRGAGSAPNGLVAVEAPMIGVFYRAPEPGAAPFVEVGERGHARARRCCLLEAMKLFNELKADTPGVVRAIHVENGEPVEFGQLLFELEPGSAARWTHSDVLRVLVANRGEVAVRVIRALHELGMRSGRRVLDGGRGRDVRPHGRPRAPHRAAGRGAELPQDPVAHRGRDDDRLRRGASRLGLPRREPGVRARVRGERARLHRPDAGGHGRMGDKARAKHELREAGVPLVPGTEGSATIEQARAAADELGFPCRSRRRRAVAARAAPRRRAEELEDAFGSAAAGGAGCVRDRIVRREGDRPGAARRDPGARRRARWRADGRRASARSIGNFSARTVQPSSETAAFACLLESARLVSAALRELRASPRSA